MFMLLSKFDITKSPKLDNKAHHGEEPMDRVGGTVRSLKFRAMKSEKNSIIMPKEFSNA